MGNLKRNAKQRTKKQFRLNALIVVLDIVAVNASYYVALIARFYGFNDLSELFQQKLSAWMRFAPIYTIVCLLILVYCKLYSGMWKYAGMHDFNRILFASVTTSLLHTVGTWLFIEHMPRTYYVLGALLQFFCIGGIRLGYRIFLMEKAKIIRHTSPAENAMIVGHGGNAKMVMEYIENDKEHNLRPVCIIDDENHMNGFSMNGVPVIGGPDRIEYGIEKYKVRNVFIANPLLDNEIRKQLEKICRERYLNLRDYAGYLVYMDRNDVLLMIVKAPTTMSVEGSDKRIVPFSPPDIGEKEINEVTGALRSGRITTGPRTKLLERRLAAFIEMGETDADCNTDENIIKYYNRVVCLNSGTSAEELNLRILGIRPGDEVIVPAYTFTATASAAIHCGQKWCL